MRNDRVDFVGIGAPKCGTTWLSDCLAEHPEIGFAPDKEVYYFADSEARTYANSGFNYYERGPDWYHRQFPLSKPGARVFGEYSVSYMYDPRTCPRMKAYNPDLRILVALRNPVDMVYSWYWYNRTGLIAKLPETFEQAVELPFVRDLGFFHRALSPFFREFPATNIHVVFHQDIRRDPRAVLRRLFAFLGVDVDFEPATTGERVNAAKTTRFRSLQTVGQATYNALKRIPPVAALVSSRPFEKAVLAVYERINRVPQQYPPIDPAIRRTLTEVYRPDVERLEKLLEVDLGAWLRADRDRAAVRPA
jgi:hypothetical protein